MTYNKVNQMTGLNRFSDLSGANLVAESSYTFDQSQRLIQLTHKKGANNLASYDYTYDSANKLTKIVSSIDGTIDYTYDATNQLTGADHSSQADEAYQYDANGNRTNAGYQTGTNNQLLADGQFTYEYDHEGNRTKRTETATGKVTEYIWDSHNRLTGVMFKDATGAVLKLIEYIYDVNNQRIGKKIDGVVTERYVLDRNQIALVFDGQGVAKSRYLYGTQIDQVLADQSSTQVHWFLADHQGTIKDVLDNAGTVIDHITYDSFGRIINQTNPIELRFAYTGREWDGETGQYYYRARYYDPSVGRFISEDPISFGGGDSNLSRYVGNTASYVTDPSGLKTVPCPDVDCSGLQRGGGMTVPTGGRPGIGPGGTPGGGRPGTGTPVNVPRTTPNRPNNRPGAPPTNSTTNPIVAPSNIPGSPGRYRPLLPNQNIYVVDLTGKQSSNTRARIKPNQRNSNRIPDCRRPIPMFFELTGLPEHYALVSYAISQGRPTILTKVDSTSNGLNRSVGNKYVYNTYGNATSYRTDRIISEWDEYPYASTLENNSGAFFAAVSKQENREAGSELLSFYRDNNLQPGCKFRVML
jgi:RHS repeat-associated protein